MGLAFGKTAFGRIFTVINTGVTVASAFGPLANGLVKDVTGRFHAYFLITGLISLAAFGLCLFTPLPHCDDHDDGILLGAVSEAPSSTGEEPPNETTALVSMARERGGGGGGTYRAVAGSPP